MPHFSVITPSHHLDYILDCYESLLLQSDSDWEWILLLNGKATKATIDFRILQDPRVRVISSEATHARLGAHWRRAAAAATGKILVELDHDDQLKPDCLAALRETEHQHGPGFYYSNLNNFRFEDEPEDPDFQAFEPDVTSLLHPSFCPRAVRAWSSSTYFEVGGHDSTIEAGSDIDLLCRTYLSGCPFVHIDKSLYVKRYYHNSSRQRIEYIKAQNEQLATWRRSYLSRIAAEWARRRPELTKLNLGSDQMEGFQTIWPFRGNLENLELAPENSVSVVRAANTLQYIPRVMWTATMNAIYRCLAPGGYFVGMFPDANGDAWHADPQAVNPVKGASFLPFTDKRMSVLVPRAKAKFRIAHLETTSPSDWHFHHNLLYTDFVFCAMKNQRAAGPQFI